MAFFCFPLDSQHIPREQLAYTGEFGIYCMSVSGALLVTELFLKFFPVCTELIDLSSFDCGVMCEKCKHLVRQTCENKHLSSSYKL